MIKSGITMVVTMGFPSSPYLITSSKNISTVCILNAPSSELIEILSFTFSAPIAHSSIYLQFKDKADLTYQKAFSFLITTIFGIRAVDSYGKPF